MRSVQAQDVWNARMPFQSEENYDNRECLSEQCRENAVGRRRRRVMVVVSSAICLIAAFVYRERSMSSSSYVGKKSIHPMGRKVQSPFFKMHTFSRALEDEGDEEEQQEEDDEEENNEQEDQQQEDEEEEEADQEEDQDNNEDEENDEQQEEEQADDQQDEQEEEGEEDQEQDEEEQEESRDGGPEEDDWFDDGLADDQLGDDDSTHYIDDFYAYQEDPRPPSLLPFTYRSIVAYFLVSMALTLGASGGIGGGGVVVPVYLLVMGLSPRLAIPIGAATVLGGAMASTMMNWRRRHPLADRPVIDWDLILLMEPLTLVGTLFGTLCHRLLSEKLLVVLLVLLLSVTAHSTLKKAMRMYQAEKRYIRQLKAAQAEPPSGSPPRGYSVFGAEDDEYHEHHKLDAEEKEQILILNPDYVTLKTNLQEEEKFTPRSKIMAIVSMFSILCFLNVMVGGGSYQSPWNIRCGSVAFWVVHVIMVAFLIAFAWAAQTYLIMRHEIKDMVRFNYVHGDIKWDARSAIIYPAVFVSAGLFAGMFGIGGGVIIVPLLLTVGVHPAVASATSSAMILFTSTASTSTYMIFGLLLTDFAVFGFCVGFVSSLIGQVLMKQARQARSASGRNFERNSYITFVIGGVVLISALLMTVQYVFAIVEEPGEGYGGLCDGLRF